MTRQEANQLLDEHKHGINSHSLLAVTKALWICGDLRGSSPRDLIASCENGKDSGIQSLHMAQGASIGE
jgi:hypothetical protein